MKAHDNTSCDVLSMKGTAIFLVILAGIFGPASGGTNWKGMGKDTLSKLLNKKENTNIAKNVILFIGDGMGASTVTAARIYKGQKMNKTGEETVLAFEEFSDIAMSKTYATDRQVPDSAATATALMCGVKTKYKVIGATEATITGDCPSIKGNEAISLLDQFHAEGRATGVVTTARITHATPAAAYAHVASRDWEGDTQMVNVTGNCRDIAYQLVYEKHDIQVSMGGGRQHFLPNTVKDPETNTTNSKQRQSQTDLTMVWKHIQKTKRRRHAYVWNKEQFDAIDPEQTDYLLGLFHPDHMQYEIDRDTSPSGEPSLTDMTSKAIKILKKNSKGFFLQVESGRIDHAHHESRAKRALEETIQFEEAINEAIKLTDEKDTLILVTADHSHVFSIGGYPNRGNDILGIAHPQSGAPPLDNKPYTTLLYANGPGFSLNGSRQNITHVDTSTDDYVYQSAVLLLSETHSGEDVIVYARGPMSHLVKGIQEQHYFNYVMQFSACVGEYKNRCSRPNENECVSEGTAVQPPHFLFFPLIVCHSFIFRLSGQF